MRKHLVFSFLLIILLLQLALVSNSFAARRALLIGINDYDVMGGLDGCINDVSIMTTILTRYFGFNEEKEILPLTKSSEATKNNILSSIDNWLIKGTVPGDKVLLFFSGHGVQIKDLNGDEEDGCDEALCPSNANPPGSTDYYDCKTYPIRAEDIPEMNLIVDDEIAARIERLKGRIIVIIADSCSSGTIYMNINTIPRELFEYNKLRTRQIPTSFSQLNTSFWNPNPSDALDSKGFFIEKSDVTSNMILISGCDSNESSNEIPPPDDLLKELPNIEYAGALTIALYQGLKTKGAQVTFEELHSFIKDYIKRLYEKNPSMDTQTPQLDTSNALKKKKLTEILK
jgi:hypothetical protein